MKKTNAIVISVGIGMLIVAFQNCSNQTAFTSDGVLVSKAAVDTSGANTDGGAIVDPNPTTPPPAATPPSSTYPPTAGGGYPPRTSHDDDDDDDHDHDHDSDHGNHHHPGVKQPCQNSGHTAANSKTALNFVCVLRGNGKSERIGLSSGALAGQVGTPQDVCMSENACLKILATKFEVRSAEPRGFCKTLSAHTVSMTDLEIEAALAKEALQQAMSTAH